MNLFRIDDDPAVTASQLADRHVRKMVLEGAQVLSTACRLVSTAHPDLWGRYSAAIINDIDEALYAVAHRYHPVTLYATSRDGAACVLEHSRALCQEFRWRWGKHHKSEAVIETASMYIRAFPELTIVAGQPVAPVCVDEDLRTLPDFDAYRAHLLRKYQTWERPPVWTQRPRPTWVL